MKLSIPGQLHGPECKSVITEAVALRKELEPVFAALDSEKVHELSVCLRVNGSLGEFGPEGLESIELRGKTIESELVIGNHNWASLQPDQISAVLRPLIHRAVAESLAKYRVHHPKGIFSGILQNGT